MKSTTFSWTLVFSWARLERNFAQFQRCGSESGIQNLFGPWVQDLGWGKKTRSGSGTNIPDDISECLETLFWVKNT
jgi:hypothetical protein